MEHDVNYASWPCKLARLSTLIARLQLIDILHLLFDSFERLFTHISGTHCVPSGVLGLCSSHCGTFCLSVWPKSATAIPFPRQINIFLQCAWSELPPVPPPPLSPRPFLLGFCTFFGLPDNFVMSFSCKSERSVEGETVRGVVSADLPASPPLSPPFSSTLSLSLGCFVLSVCLGPMCQSQLGKKFAFYYFVAFIVGIVGTF